MSSLPPPLPPLPTAPAHTAAPRAPAAEQKRSGVAIGLIGILACASVFGVVVLAAALWLVNMGWSLLADQARSAMQDDALVQEHIGQIRSMRLDLLRTGMTSSGEEFVFDVEGDRGAGRVKATWVTAGADREILSDGVLTLRDGTEYTLPAAATTFETDAEPESAIGSATDTAMEH
ncbi:hypothetical protein ACCQ13_18395 [Xanthomonas sp. NCPPB 1638]|uniref:Uncharacterized protein n=1 Tax=Xanthomonas cucurbitae TaxID=56453 RepID=A0A2S7DQG9_9XANT|nr:hypothetical protein [Xanthomonas cucurbitae]PPU76052.1 hypothetical protein XcuCFBP2542_11860 [Xanthomonas cucurbitae]QHG89229.1 hypothetical protein EBN15_17975 [Xanthomonas cucurbitae]WDM75134.1 hypothetical protein K6982_17595 [Xanthomonas cucurbitae]WDM78844.1 hypothetical protein K6980_17240 [Xanthomonas cucurbitae]WDM82524.1 hypothetical protein K6979_17235 [Xanthomonas cucurbitae]